MNINPIARHLKRTVLLLLTISLLVPACGDAPNTPITPDPQSQNSISRGNHGLERAMEVQTRNTERFLEKKGVVGTGTGMTEDGTPAIIIFTERPLGKKDIPDDIDGIPVIEEVIGKVEALSLKGQPQNSKKGGNSGNPSSSTNLSPTDRWTRPAPVGTATSNWNECGSGTLGVRVRRGESVFVISNNHVFGRMNNALTGEIILQPGRSDVSCTQEIMDEVGRIAEVHPLSFSTTASNIMDAAMASTTTSLISNATPGDGYGVPSNTTATAYVGMPVQKYGRSSRLTKGKVSAINVIVGVTYYCGSARFINQIAIQPLKKKQEFALGGDSGSLIVTDDSSAEPVALLFAKSGTTVFASPIDPILTQFNVTIDGK